MPTTVRLDPDIESRLDHLARATGRSKAFYLKELIESNLDDLEDIYLAEKRLEDLRAGRSDSVSAEEAWGDLGETRTPIPHG